VIEMATFVLVHGAFGSPAELAPVFPCSRRSIADVVGAGVLETILAVSHDDGDRMLGQTVPGE